MLSIKGDLTIPVGDQTGYGMKDGGFPGAIGTDQGNNLSGIHLKADIVQRVNGSVVQVHVLNLQHAAHLLRFHRQAFPDKPL